MATLIERSTHYNGSVEIKFYPNSHRYQIEGRKNYLIGVTTATGMKDKSTPLMIWAGRLTKAYLEEVLKSKAIEAEDIETAINQHNVKKEEAATSGTMVHDWAEAYIKGERPTVPEDEKVRNGVLAFLKWVQENDIKFISSERKVYSKKHEYVGTMDVEFTMGITDHKVIYPGDFKTSSAVYLPMTWQVAAYQEATTEEHGTVYGDMHIIRFQKEDKIDKYGNVKAVAGEFEVKSFPAADHEERFRGFLACLEMKKQDKVWEKLHGYYSKNK